MLIDRLLNDGSTQLMERVLDFTAQRHRLIAENVVNISTPGYQQKDLSLEKFQGMLRETADRRHACGDKAASFSDIQTDVEDANQGILFHDGQSRSMEQLMTDQAKNALMHNVVIEMLRKQFQQLEMALKDKPT